MASVSQRVMEQYPQFAFLLRDPQVGSLLAQATNPSQPWSPLKFQAELQKTRWYKRNSAAQRKNAILMYTDPATYNSGLGQNMNLLKRYSEQLGITINPSETRWIASVLMGKGQAMNSIEAQQALFKILKADPRRGTTGSIGRFQHAVNAMVTGDWMMPQAPKNVATWGQKIAFGSLTIEDLNMYFAKQAAKKFPWMAEEIAQGSNIKQIMTDRAAAFADQLDLTPEDVFAKMAFDKGSKEAQLLGVRDPTSGKTRLPNMAEVQKMARLDNRWWGSSKGRETDASMAANLLNVFGKRKMGSA